MKKQFTLLLSILFSLFLFQNTFGQFTQLGTDIDGVASGDRFGYTVKLSADGSIFAAGSPMIISSGDSEGQVRVFEYNAGSWTQLGQDINGTHPEDYAGLGIGMNAAGDRLVVGSPGNDNTGDRAGNVRVFEYSSNVWTQIGQEIGGDAPEDGLGRTISMSADGSTLALGIPYSNSNGTYSGQAKIFRLVSGSWVQIGTDLHGGSSTNFFGTSLELSNGGNIVAIGEEGNNRAITIFEYNGSDWQVLGDPILSPEEHYQFGEAVKLSADGYTLATLASKVINNEAFMVGIVFKYDGTSWNTMGSQLIESGYTDSIIESSLDMNDAGNVVAIGRFGTNGSGSDEPGTTTISQFINNDWVQVGAGIVGENENDYAGFAVSLNAVGDKVAIGAPHNNDSAGTAGQVRVFRTEDLGVYEHADVSGFTLFPNPVRDILNIVNSSQQDVESVAVYSLIGQEILFQQGSGSSEHSIDLSNLQAGNYFVQITTNKGITRRRFIKR